MLETQKIEATVYILWHIATYVRSWLQNSRNGVGLVEFDLGFLVCANLNRESVVTSEISSTSQSVLFHPNILRTPFNSIMVHLIVSFPDKQDIRLSCSFSYLLLTCDLSTILPHRDFDALRSQALASHPACIVPYGFPPTAPRSLRTSPALATILDKADVAFLGDIVVCQPATLKTAKIARLKILDRSCIDHARLPKQVSQSA